MSAVTLDQALQLAHQALLGGQLPEAESICNDILAAMPEQPGALHLLGGVALQANRRDLAEGFLRRSLAANPENDGAMRHLGELLGVLGRPAEAAGWFEQSLSVWPDDPDTLNNLGVTRLKLKLFTEAVGCLGRALALRPGFAFAHDNLGLALHHLGRHDESASHYERAVQLDPNFADAHKHLGRALVDRKQPTAAVPLLERALRLKPGDAQTHNDLGVALASLREYERAREHFVRALEIEPDNVVTLDNLGSAYRKLERTREARECFERALAVDPGFHNAYGNLASLYRTLGQAERALDYARQAVVAGPEVARHHSDLVLAAYYHPAFRRQELTEVLAGWNARHAAPLAARRRPHTNDRDPERPLRVGYVSPDFAIHVVSHFSLPLLRAHHRRQVETHCYASVVQPDFITERLREAAHVWHDAVALSDEQLAEQVRADGIDILVDLAMHTGGNRLPTFGYKPAPVQVSWLAFAGSTGLETMDYRLTDRFMDPPDAAPWGSETPVRLPDGWCCFDPLYESPPVESPPCLRNGFVTFGSLNNFVKVNAPTLRRWAGVVRAVAGSRLLIHAAETEAHEFSRSVLAEEGIVPDRVEFIGRQYRDEYLQTYARIDVGLDPFPFNGMTTTCDALWMGVPVLTLPGDMPNSRAGLSLLQTVGLDEWVATDEDDYRRKAAQLTANPTRLWQLRMGLRKRMQASPLMDEGRFARGVEAAYREMWRRWCRDGKG